MHPLVTLEEASAHLRRDTNDDDHDLELKVHAASAAIRNYLKDTCPYQTETDTAGEVIILYDSHGEPLVRNEVRAATLLMVGILYRDRDGQDNEIWEKGYLPKPIIAILYPLRIPTVA